MAQLFVSGMAHFFVVVSGSKIHERVAHFFIDIYKNESAKFWATVLNGLKNRGVEDIFIACTDNLTGFEGHSQILCKVQ